MNPNFALIHDSLSKIQPKKHFGVLVVEFVLLYENGLTICTFFITFCQHCLLCKSVKFKEVRFLNISKWREDFHDGKWHHRMHSNRHELRVEKKIGILFVRFRSHGQKCM